MTTAPTFLALTGATATGKTALSLAVARRLAAEIVSMDSRQVYCGMDVGTAKVGLRERAGVPHHGLDLLAPAERYSAGRFARDARGWIRDVRSRGRVPLLVGGTGFFLRALTEPLAAEPILDPSRLRRLRAALAAFPREKLETWVRVLDPDRAPVSVAGGPQRMVRTLEVALLSGRRQSWWHECVGPEEEGLEGVVVVLALDRRLLYERIDARARAMVAAGLVDEVRRLVEAGFGESDPGMTGTGYREMLRYLRGEWTLEEAIEEIARATRAYARRQETWFRHQVPDDAVRIDAAAPPEEQVESVLRAWRARRTAPDDRVAPDDAPGTKGATG